MNGFLVWRFWKWLPGLLMAVGSVSAQAQTVEYLHIDALGTLVAVTNTAGVVIERSEYEPYGKLLNRPLADGPGFTGHVQDAATGLTYMQQRYFDPAIGRFLSVDPVVADSITGWNFNRYSYVANNPYRFTDPDGRCLASRIQSACDSLAGLPKFRSAGPIGDVSMQGDGESGAGGHTSDAIDGEKPKSGGGATGSWAPGATSTWDWPEVPTEGVDPFYPEFDLLPLLKGLKLASLGTLVFKLEARQEIQVLGHALRRFPEAEGRKVAGAIAQQISGRGTIAPGVAIQETIMVGGKEYSYRAFVLSDGRVSVGTAVEGRFGRDVAQPK